MEAQDLNSANVSLEDYIWPANDMIKSSTQAWFYNLGDLMLGASCSLEL